MWISERPKQCHVFNINVGPLFSGVRENHAMPSRECCPDNLVAQFVTHTSQLLASAYVTRGVFVYKMALPQMPRRVSFLSDLAFNMNWLIKCLFKKLNQSHL